VVRNAREIQTCTIRCCCPNSARCSPTTTRRGCRKSSRNCIRRPPRVCRGVVRRGDLAAAGPCLGGPASRGLLLLPPRQASGDGQRHRPDRMSKLLEAMPPDDRVDLLKRLDHEVVESLMPLVTRAERQDIRTCWPSRGQRRLGHDDRIRVAARRYVRGRRDRLAAAAGPLARDDLFDLRAGRRPSPAGLRFAARSDPGQTQRRVSPTSCNTT